LNFFILSLGRLLKVKKIFAAFFCRALAFAQNRISTTENVNTDFDRLLLNA